MGKPTVTQAIAWLTEQSIRAARGYPGTPMPQIVGLAVAVITHKAEPGAVTYKAIVCVPKRLGMTGCENGAALISAIWEKNGACCTWGDGVYDAVMGNYTVDVYGRWEDPVAEE